MQNSQNPRLRPKILSKIKFNEMQGKMQIPMKSISGIRFGEASFFL